MHEARGGGSRRHPDSTARCIVGWWLASSCPVVLSAQWKRPTMGGRLRCPASPHLGSTLLEHLSEAPPSLAGSPNGPLPGSRRGPTGQPASRHPLTERAPAATGRLINEAPRTLFSFGILDAVADLVVVPPCRADQGHSRKMRYSGRRPDRVTPIGRRHGERSSLVHRRPPDAGDGAELRNSSSSAKVNERSRQSGVGHDRLAVQYPHLDASDV